MAQIHVGDIGTNLIVEMLNEDGDVIDLSLASEKLILLYSPSGTRTENEAEFVTNGEDGQIQYTTQEDDLFESGYWKLQGVINIGELVIHGEVQVFEVFSNI